jgi:hypothetical protein
VSEILKLNDQLMNAPAGVIVALFSIALGYVLKISAFFPNNFIPLVIVLFTASVFPVLEFCDISATLTGGVGDRLIRESAMLRIPINVLIGFIIGFVAWTFHAQILKRFVDPKFFNDDGSTKFLKRDQTNNQTPTP